MSHTSLHIGVFSFFVLTVASAVSAQGLPQRPTRGTNPPVANDVNEITMVMGAAPSGSIVVRVYGAQDAPLKQQAYVQLFRRDSGMPVRDALTQGDSQVSFSQLGGPGDYTVQVSAAGYRTQSVDFDYRGDSKAYEVDMRMQPDPDDESPAPDLFRGLPSAARKHLEKGLAEFRLGDFKAARKQFVSAHDRAPKSLQTNYLLALADLRTRDLQHSETYFRNALAIDPEDVPSLVGLGNLVLQKGDLPDAANVLERAVALDHKQWEALWMLAEIHLRQGSFETARKEAESAVEFGQGRATGAEFIEAQALAGLGHRREAVEEVQTFLRDAPSDPNADSARRFAAKLELGVASSAAVATTESPVDGQSVVPRLSEGRVRAFDWEPPSVDDEKLPLAAGVTCPDNQVINGVGRRVIEFVDDVNRIQAREDVTHQELTTLGHPMSTEKRNFEYLVTIADSGSGLLISEDRDDSTDQAVGPLSMFGLADLPLVFHPSLRGDFQMSGRTRPPGSSIFASGRTGPTASGTIGCWMGVRTARVSKAARGLRQTRFKSSASKQT